MNRIQNLLHFCNISVKHSAAIPCKKIDYYDLTMVLSGSLTYFVNEKEYILKENDVILLPPGSLRQRIAGESADYASFNFEWAGESEIPLDIFLENAVTPDIRKILSLFAEEHLSLFYHSKEKATCVLHYIILELLDHERLPTGNPHIRRALKYIEENIEKNISLVLLARHLHLSKEYTATLFKAEIGKTVSEYVNEKKMQIAKRMLAETDYSLKEISERLGFDHYGYFSRLYKKYFKTAPSRQKKKWS